MCIILLFYTHEYIYIYNNNKNQGGDTIFTLQH
jgi:hypothetical protein